MKIQTPSKLNVLLALLLLAVVLLLTSSEFYFTLLDRVVHGDLYGYGLQFNYEWATKYWTYSRLRLAFLGVAGALTIVVAIFLLLDARPKRIYSSRLFSLFLASAGGIALVLSIIYDSSVLSYIGLGLVFWGLIILYARPEPYIKKTLLNATFIPAIENQNLLIKSLGYEGKGIYLPPRYLESLELSRVFISAQQDGTSPSLEQMQNQEDEVFLKNPEGILITPPGAELTKLFEEKMGTSFTIVDFQNFEKKLQRILIDDLEIAQKLKVAEEKGKIHMNLESPVYLNPHKSAKGLFNSLGCPLCSAIACAITKSTGKLITIEKEGMREDGKTFDTEYCLLD